MSLTPIVKGAPTLQPERLPSQVIGCGRVGLHICKLHNGEMLVALWPWLRRGLVQIQQKNPPHAKWMPEHLRLEIIKGLAGQSGTECFIAHDGDTEALHGFLIACPLIDPFVNLPLSWFVWMCNLAPGTLDRVLPEFEQMARDRGYRRWQWVTSRKGWLRRAARFGAQMIEITISKELYDGRT